MAHLFSGPDPDIEPPETPGPDIDPVAPREVPTFDPGDDEPSQPDIDPGSTPQEMPQVGMTMTTWHGEVPQHL